MDRRAWWGYMGLQRVGHDLLTEHIDIYPFSLEPLSHLPPHPTPLDCHRAPDLSSLHHTANLHWLSNFTYGNVCVSMLVCQFIPPSPSPTVSVPYVYICIAAQQIGSSVQS